MNQTQKTSGAPDMAAVREKLNSVSGPEYWRSLEQLAGTPEFQDLLKHEFPAGADTFTSATGRRRFLQVMGASLALAGVTGCTRQPKEFIMAHAANPEEALPGVARYFATAMPNGAYGEPVLAESHQNRPTKIEGNPDHPMSEGRSSVFAQASILEMYDFDRIRTYRRRGRDSSAKAFAEDLAREAQMQRQTGGAGLRILSGSSTSPTLGAVAARFRQAFPQAKWVQWDPAGRDNVRSGSMAAFGEYVETHYKIDAARVILSLDADILGNRPGMSRHVADFARGRSLDEGTANMNRLYVVEPTPTVTGTNADHRLRLKASEVAGFAAALAAELGVAAPAAGELPEKAQEWIAPLAADLRSAGSRALVVAGDEQPAATHTIAHAINAALGAVGTTVLYNDPLEIAPVDQAASLRELVEEMKGGKVEALLTLNSNPVYNAPADLDFRAALEEVPFRVALTQLEDETAVLAHWQVPSTHYLEAWGDIRAIDGSVLLQQPMVEPLYGGISEIELLAMFLGEESTNGYDLVRARLMAEIGQSGGAFEKTWRKLLHDGYVPGSAEAPRAVAMKDGWAAGVSMPAPAQGVEAIFRPDPTIGDGRFNNNGWMQELPKPVTKLTWENAVLVSPATAEQMSLRNGDVVSIGLGEAKVEGPVWITPGQADGVATLALGYGRERTGHVGMNAGFNAYALRTTNALWQADGLDLAKTGKRVELACVQDHSSMEGRHLVRIANAAEYDEHNDFAQRVGHHAPGGHDESDPGVGAPYVGGLGADEESGPDADVKFESGRSTGIGYADVENDMSFFPEWNYTGNAWGMAIDLNKCVGCNACTAACGAENNIPVIGKEEVSKGREMHWIRIDRYFSGSLDDPATHYQPVNCMQCENAPCEVVCPVGATVHSSEGLNDMVYNRCVGTRYCSNNCPYKVRRFNFLLYSDFETDSLKLMRNPDVTVRSRGVMEKCTYCVQRINSARIQAGKEDREIRDGEIVTACEQACPAEAITFGNINDPNSRVAKAKQDPRNYGLLEELNTQPRTTFLARVRNPNPDMPDARAHEESDGEGSHA